MSILDLLAAVIIALVPFNVSVTLFLFFLLGGHTDLVTLRIRAYTQFFLTVCSAIGGVFGIARFTGGHLDPTVAVVLLTALIILPSIPGLYWAFLYLTDGID